MSLCIVVCELSLLGRICHAHPSRVAADVARTPAALQMQAGIDGDTEQALADRV